MEINETWQLIGGIPFGGQQMSDMDVLQKQNDLMAEVDGDTETVWIYRWVA